MLCPVKIILNTASPVIFCVTKRFIYYLHRFKDDLHHDIGFVPNNFKRDLVEDIKLTFSIYF